MPPVRPAKVLPRATYHHGNLRRALIEESLGILAEGGPETFTLREAARRAGVDHRAAYRHFEDREALLAAVAAEGYAALVRRVRAALLEASAADAPSRVRCVLRECVLFAADEPAYYRVMTGPRLNETGRFPELEPAILEAFGVLESELVRGVKSRELVQLDTAETAIVLWALAHGVANLVLTRRVRIKRDKLPAYAERLVDHALFGIVQRPGKPARKRK